MVGGYRNCLRNDDYRGANDVVLMPEAGYVAVEGSVACIPLPRFGTRMLPTPAKVPAWLEYLPQAFDKRPFAVNPLLRHREAGVFCKGAQLLKTKFMAVLGKDPLAFVKMNP